MRIYLEVEVRRVACRRCGKVKQEQFALAEDLHTRFRIYIANDDDGPVRALLTHPQVALGLSDAGGH